MGYLARLTVAGANANAVRDYQRERARALDAAVRATEIGINRYTLPAAGNEYANLISTTRTYDVPTLGDVDGDTSWMDVLNTAVGQVSQGVSNLIGGRPQSTTIVQAAPAKAAFPWMTAAVIGGGALAVFFLLKKRRR